MFFLVCRDASWELEANAYAELLEVYSHCDALACLCNDGRTHSAKSGYDTFISVTVLTSHPQCRTTER